MQDMIESLTADDIHHGIVLIFIHSRKLCTNRVNNCGCITEDQSLGVVDDGQQPGCSRQLFPRTDTVGEAVETGNREVMDSRQPMVQADDAIGKSYAD